MKSKSTWTQNAGIGMFALLLIFTVGCGREGSFDNGTRIQAGSGSSADPATSKVYIYATTDAHQGDLGGRVGADQICQNDLPGSLVGYETHALLGYSATEDLNDLPTTYGLPTSKEVLAHGTEAVIADDWAGLLSGSINMSMSDTGVLPVGTIYWTGFNGATGEAVTQGRCLGFDALTGDSGQIGHSQYADMEWFAHQADNCTAAYPFLCIAYVPSF